MISIIICTYNRCESLKNTLDSLLNLEGVIDLDYEVIVVDNNSKDKTKPLVEFYNVKTNGKIKYLFEGKQGKTYALNKGIQKSQGEIIAFTDDDVIVDKYWLRNIKEIFRDETIAEVGGKVLPIWPSKEPHWFIGQGKYALMGPIAMHDYGDQTIECTKGICPPIGANMVVKRSVFTKYGYFNTEIGRKGRSLNRKGEDTEIGKRLRSAGEKVIYHPNLIIHHRVFPVRATKNYFRKWYFMYGKNNVAMKEYVGKTIFIFGIPFGLYKQLLKNFSMFLFSIFMFNSKIRFYWELKNIFILGKMFECLQLKKKALCA